MATSVATTALNPATGGTRRPSMPRLVRVAKIPAAGVKPPYIHPWNAAASEPRSVISIRFYESKTHGDVPATTPPGPKPRVSTSVVSKVNVTAHAMMMA